MDMPDKTSQIEEPEKTKPNHDQIKPTDIHSRFYNALRLKDFALIHGYEIDSKTLDALNNLYLKTIPGPKIEQFNIDKDITLEELNDLDQAISELTRITYPVTMESLSEQKESRQYKRFKFLLMFFGVIVLIGAILGFCISVKPTPKYSALFGNNILALSLGFLGAVVYSLFNVLRIIPPQAFNPSDEYSNYARLLLGPLLGWIFYFSFCITVFLNLQKMYNSDGTEIKTFFLLIPFVAGYSTNFVISLLEKVIQALEIAIGVEEKRDLGLKKSKEKVQKNK